MPFLPFGSPTIGNPIERPRGWGDEFQEIIITSGGTIHSAGFEPSTDGFILRSDGTAEYSGEVIIGGTLSVTGLGRIKIGTADDYMDMFAGNGYARITAVAANWDNPGFLAWNTDGNQSMYLVGQGDDDQWLPSILFDTADSVGEAWWHYDFALWDYGSASKYMTTLVRMAGLKDDMVGLLLQHGLVSTPTAPALQLESRYALSANINASASPNDLEISYPASGNTGGGLHTNQAMGRLPMAAEGNIGSSSMTATGTWTTIGGALSFPQYTHGKVTGTAQGTVTIFSNSATARVRIRLQVSYDGGTTYTTNGASVQTQVDATHNYDSLTPLIFINGSPNGGNVMVRMQYYTSNTTPTLSNIRIMGTLLGDL
jgi:hypothetical protein